jgi:hypothetical protein
MVCSAKREREKPLAAVLLLSSTPRRSSLVTREPCGCCEGEEGVEELRRLDEGVEEEMRISEVEEEAVPCSSEEIGTEEEEAEAAAPFGELGGEVVVGGVPGEDFERGLPTLGIKKFMIAAILASYCCRIFVLLLINVHYHPLVK